VWERLRATSLYRDGIALPAAEHDTEDVVTVVSAGQPSPGIRVAILGARDQPLPDGRVGEVALQTPSRMEGYLRDARATQRAIRGRYLKTGDLGYVRGRELFWTGRVRERITIRGRKLDPSDFEPVLLEVDGLRRGCFVAFGVDDVRRGTQKVVVAAELGGDRADPGTIAGEIRERVLRQLGIALADVVLVPRGALTKTTSGKRRHRAHRDLYLDGTLEALRVGDR
jgi:acyl-CoA synthetase (AMP-forming)/AMP-acid ligase II